LAGLWLGERILEGGTRRRIRFPSLSGVVWLCIGSIALGVFSLGHQSISQRRQARAVDWLQKAGVTVTAIPQLYWQPPVGGVRSVVSYQVRFPPSAKKLTPYEIESLLTLSGVRSLDLSYNTVDDELARTIAGIRSLEELILHRTGLSDAGLLTVARLPALRKLSVGATATTPDVVQAVERDRNLSGLYQEWVRWKFWQLTGEAAGVSPTTLDITPKTVLRREALPLLAELPDLNTVLIRQQFPMTKSLLDALGEAAAFQTVRIQDGVNRDNAHGLRSFKAAVEMSIAGPLVDDAVLSGISSLPHLQILTVTANHLTGQGIGGLTDLPELREFRLYGTPAPSRSQGGPRRRGPLQLLPQTNPLHADARAAAAGYETLTRMPQLRTADLRGLPLDGEAIRHLRQIPSLEVLTLQHSVVFADDAAEELKTFGTHPALRQIALPAGLTNPQVMAILESLRSAPALKSVTVPARNREVYGSLGMFEGLLINVY